MIGVAVILGSIRPGRIGEGVAKWAYSVASKRTDAEYEFVDIKDFGLPLLDEPTPPSMHRYTRHQDIAWGEALQNLRTRREKPAA